MLVGLGGLLGPLTAQTGEPLTFVGDADYPPVSFRDGSGPRGIDPELVAELGRRLGRPTVFDAVDYDDGMRRVVEGRADAITDFGILPERREQFDFTQPVLTHDFVFYVRASDDSVRGVADLAGKRIGCFPWSFASGFLERQGYTAVRVPELETAFSSLVDGTLDVLAVDNWAAAPVARNFRQRVKQVGPPFATIATAIAVQKGRTDLVDRLNVAIAAIKSDGTLDRIEDRWRPGELLFVPTDSVRRWGAELAGLLLVVAVVALALWVRQMRRQIRVRAEAASALAASEEKFALAFRASPEAMSISDFETRRFIDVNDRFLTSTGLVIEDVRGRTLAELGLTATPVEEVSDAIRELPPGEGFEWQMRSRTGRLVTVVTSAQRILLNGRHVILSTHRDITASREMEAQLRQAQKMEAVGRLAAGIAHDFNNVLTVILGNAELAQLNASALPTSVQGALGEIRAAGDHAASLTRQLLMFSRRSAPHVEVVDLNAIVDAMRNMLGRLLGADIELVLNLAEDAPRVWADPAELQQIVLNLAVNGREAMPHGGRLTMRTSVHLPTPGGDDASRQEPHSAFVLLQVSDTGVGMDEGTRSRIFEPFFTTKPVGQGTGLGLATVYAIVTKLGGRLQVTSEVGAGSEFSVSLPASSEDVADVVGRAPASVDCGGRVWVVDDAAEIRRLMMKTLTSAGFTVRTFESATEALAAFDVPADRPELLITDVVMPAMSGIQLVKALEGRVGRIKVLYVSGNVDPGTLELETGSVELLDKPFLPDDLLRRVSSLITASRRSGGGDVSMVTRVGIEPTTL